MVLLILGGLFFGRQALEAGDQVASDRVINFYNWGDYIDPDLLKTFEAQTGYKVVYETFDSNEAMMTKLQQGGTKYDVIVPSEYMIEALKEEDLLLELDHSKLPNMKQLDSQFMDLAFDPGNKYSLPYFWGTLGIIYNSKIIPEGSIQEWQDLWDPIYRRQILMIDGAREVLGIGLQSLGYSLNEESTLKLEEATQVMKSLMPNVVGLVTDEIKMHIGQDEVPIAVTFSGEAASAMEENQDLVYVVPKSGSNLWLDNFAIPKHADNPQGAYELINFLTSAQASLANAEYIGYATPNKEAYKQLDPAITSDRAFYPDSETMAHLEVYKHLGKEKLIQYNDLFLEIKIEPES